MYNLSLKLNSITKPVCFQGKEAVNICCSQPCQRSSFICFDSKCQCHKPHQSCHNFCLISILFDKLSHKLNSIEKSMYDCTEWFNRIEKIVAREKYDWTNRSSTSENMGLEKYQSKLYSQLMGEKYNGITGKMMCKVIESLRARPEAKLKDSIKGINAEFNKSEEAIKSAIENVKKIWKENTNQESAGGTLINSLKNMFSNDSRVKPNEISANNVKSELKSCNVRRLWIDDKEIYPVPQKIEIKNLTAICLDRFTIKCAEILGTFSLKLNYLNIGGNCEKSNVDDECCRAIAYYLKQINHLMISHSPITDKGGFLLAQEIPNLKTLHLRFNNSMTVPGKEAISNMLSGCDFR